MDDTVIWKVSLTTKGEYNPATQYERLDVVQYQGSGYIVRKQCQGVTPSDWDTYILAVERGKPGGEMTLSDVKEEINNVVSLISHTIFETIGPSDEVTTDISEENSQLKPVSEIKLVQEWDGTPSLDNIRNITGWDGITFTHNGKTTTQALPETVYGGSYDWAKGELTVINKMNTYDGSEEWTIGGKLLADGKDYYYTTPISDAKYGSHTVVVCNRFLNDSISNSSTREGIDIVWSLLRIRFGNEVPVSEWKNRLASWAADGKPLQVVYELDKPCVIQLTTREFLSLSGTNTIFSNCGDTTVTFSADLKKYIDKRISELQTTTE